MLSFLIYFSTLLYSQDSHYWSNQYGTSGALLGGNVVGGVNDLSATYYNPGTLVLLSDTVSVESTNSFEFIFLKAENSLNKNLNLTQTNLRPSPSMFAVKLPFFSLKNHRLAISYLTKTDFDFDISGNLISGIQNPTYNFVSEEVKIITHLKEIWFGLTWSYSLNKNLGIGVSNYFAIRSQNGRVQLFDGEFSLLNTGNSIAFMEYNYYNVRLLWKIGVAWKMNKWNFGLTVTTPSINLFGKGNAGLTSTVFIDNNTGNPVSKSLISNYQEGLSSEFKSPVSIALGTKYTFDHTTIYFSLEWFDSVHPFHIMNPKNFIGQSDGKEYSFQSLFTSKNLMNFGMGIKHIFSSKFILYSGFSTDNSYYRDKSNNSFIQSTWDIFHMNAGGKLLYGNFNFTFGVGYSFSLNYFRKVLQLPNTPETLNPENIDYRKIKGVFGLEYKF